jgi:uncharacterized membrane protein
MITLTVDKKQFFKLFLVIYFLVYSISPLTYTLSDKQVPVSIYATNNKSSSIKSVHILLWEFFIERLSSTEENSHNNGNASILIKKKRALAPENDSGKLSSSKNTSVLEDFYNPLAPTTYSLNVLPENILCIYKGFNPLYSGNSPPANI